LLDFGPTTDLRSCHAGPERTVTVRPKSRPRRRVGRPTDSNGAATRAFILTVARSTFAELGYQAATYRVLQERTGLTVASLYHYFGSKLELYATVHQQVLDEVYDRWLTPALQGVSTLRAQLSAFLLAAHAMNRADPQLAVFLNGARVDLARHGELADIAAQSRARRVELFGGMVDAGIETGELEPSERAAAIDLLDALAIGLNAAALHEERHNHAIEGALRLVAGELLAPPARVGDR
jgi:AcrR family transcriptional regulator